MEVREEHKEYIRFKMTQASDALEEAKGLLTGGAELTYVVNSVYYAFYYPVLALLHAKGIPAAMQSIRIALFEREFIETGLIERRYYQSLRKAFELKPKCSAPNLTHAIRDEVEALISDAGEFLEAVSRVAGMQEANAVMK